MVFHWSLSDSKSPKVSGTLLSILADLSNAVVWMVSTRPPTSKSTSSFNNPSVTVPKTSITIGIIVTFMFYSYFNSPSCSTVLLLLLLLFTLWGFFLYQRQLMVFHSLSDSKFPQVSRTLLSILAVLSNFVVWMVSTCPLISKSSFSNNPWPGLYEDLGWWKIVIICILFLFFCCLF